ncbi:MAG TPA: hypothetical protein VIM16_19380 [Mucilaginibacter sp.]
MESRSVWVAFVFLKKFLIMQHPLDFYTSYNQFYIYDKGSACATDSDIFWTNDAFNDRLAIEDGVLGVGTECYGPVKGELHLLSEPRNYINLDQYDHIVEAGIEIKSGVVQILDCPNSSVELEVNVIPAFIESEFTQ